MTRESNDGWKFLPACKAEEFSGKAEEKIGRAEDFLGLFFLPPCLAEDFSGKAEDFSGLGFLLSIQKILSDGQIFLSAC